MSGFKIPFVNLGRQYQSIKNVIQNVQDVVYSNGKVLDGPYVSKFEREMAQLCERKYAVAVNSCTQALVFANIITDDGGGVLTPAVSFVATLNSSIMAKRQVYFADVNTQGLIQIPDKSPASTLIFVDLYGNVVDQDTLSWGGTIIEDAAQSLGATWKGRPAGSFGDISCLSFDPTKNLPNYGSGGMLLTNNETFYKKAKNLRDNGKLSGGVGTNSKMSESDCACMLIKLKCFPEWQKRRAKIARYYNNHLSNYVEIPKINQNAMPSWHKYVIQTDHQLPLQSHLSSCGIETKIHYPKPLCEMPNAIRLCQRVLSLPIYPELTDGEVEEVVKSVSRYFAK